MADPLSITLAVVSLATALKDVIELAQTLYDSFKKSGRNMQRAQSLSAETLRIVQELKKFYDAHTEILDSAPDMQDAVLRLLKEMETVHEDCKSVLQLYVSLDGTLRAWINQKVGPWWKRNSIEESIRTLRDGANKCRTDFMMFSLLRIEAANAQTQATVAQTHTATVRTEASLTEFRASVTYGFAHSGLQSSLPQVSDNNVLAFLGSTPVILSRLPSHVKLAEHLVYKEYITLQVGKIEILFKTLSFRGSYPVEEPDTVHLRQFKTVIYPKPVTKEEIEDVQSDIFSLIVKIQDSIQGRHNNGLSVQRGASAMSDLSVWLGVLDMDQESLTIARFAVDIYRTLTKTNEDVYGPHLAHALGLLTYRLVDTGDRVQAYKAITEAVTLGRRLVAANPTLEAQIELARLVRYSARVARLNGDLENAIQDAEEAVQSHKRLVVQSTSVLQMEVNITNKMSGPTDMTKLDATRIHRFAQAMVELHYSLRSTSRKNESVSAGIKALELYSALEQRHNYPHFSHSIADLCYSLASDGIRDVISIDQALSYAQKAVSQYEKVLQCTGNVARKLPFSLARQAKILSNLKRFGEAYMVCQKLQQIAHNHIEDHQLRAESLLQLTQSLYHSRRYAEAALVGEQLLATYRSSLLGYYLYDAYLYTSCAFEHEGNKLKAVQIAESAVSYWRMLAFHDSKNFESLAASVDNLARRLRSAADYGRAFIAGQEAMKLYSSLMKKYLFVVENYKETLQLNMDLATQAKMEPKSLERSREVIRYSRALVKEFPDRQRFFIGLLQQHAKLLEDSGKLAEGSATIEEAIIWFDSHPAEEEDSTRLHTTILLVFGRLLRDQGHLNKALSAHDKAIRVGQPFANARGVALNIFLAKTETLMILYIMGQVPLALDKIEDCLTFAAKHDLKGVEYAWYLINSSLVYRFSGDIDNALSNIQQSIDILRYHNITPHSWILSDLLADAGEEGALIAAHETIRGYEMLKGSSTTWNKEYRAQAQYSLSLRLFANNDLDQAREQLLDVRLFYQQHAQTRNVWFIKLSITLWALGHLECASGRHEEGVAARSKLADMRKHLRLVFPSLDDLAEVGLTRERNFAAWKNLLRKHQLTCRHQEE